MCGGVPLLKDASIYYAFQYFTQDWQKIYSVFAENAEMPKWIIKYFALGLPYSLTHSAKYSTVFLIQVKVLAPNYARPSSAYLRKLILFLQQGILTNSHIPIMNICRTCVERLTKYVHMGKKYIIQTHDSRTNQIFFYKYFISSFV